MINLLLLAVVPFMTEHRNVSPKTEVSTNFYGSVTGIVDNAYIQSHGGGGGVDTNAVKDIVRDELATNGIRSVDGTAKMLPKYLWSKDFYDSYPDAAEEYYRSRGDGKTDGGCSAVRDGGYLYRNFDFPLDYRAEFVVKMAAGAGRFASVGVAQVGTNLTEEIVTSGKPSPCYKWLPGATVDGINENGVVCEVNVVDGTPPASTGGDIHPMGAVRWALDNGTSAGMVASNLAARIQFPAGWTQNFHWMVADADETWIVENGTASNLTGRVVMTNFPRLSMEYGAGWERYALLTNAAVSITNAWYTRAYSRDTNWVSEFADAAEMEAAKSAWETYGKERLRGKGLWQTVHTSIYDLTNKTLRVAVQEEDDWYTFAVPSAGGGLVEEVDPTVADWAKKPNPAPVTDLAPATNYTDAATNVLREAVEDVRDRTGVLETQKRHKLDLSYSWEWWTSDPECPEDLINALYAPDAPTPNLVMQGTNGHWSVGIVTTNGVFAYVGFDAVGSPDAQELTFGFTDERYGENPKWNVMAWRMKSLVTSDKITPEALGVYPATFSNEGMLDRYIGKDTLTMRNTYVSQGTQHVVDVNVAKNCFSVSKDYSTLFPVSSRVLFSVFLDRMEYRTNGVAYTYYYPTKSGTLALDSDIPRNVSELNNDKGYLTEESEFNAWRNGSSLAAGQGAATKNYGVALGFGARTWNAVNDKDNIAIGRAAYAYGSEAVAVGDGARATKNQAVAIGDSARATNVAAVAVGAEARSHGDGTFNVNPAGGLAGFWIGDENADVLIEEKMSAKQDALPYDTNAIPAGVIADAPWLVAHQSLTPATNYTDAATNALAALIPGSYTPDPTDPAFSNAVVSVALPIGTNDLAALRDIGGLPIGEGAATVGGLLAALAAAVAWLKRNKITNPEGGTAGNVLKKTADGVEWGGGGGVDPSAFDYVLKVDPETGNIYYDDGVEPNN